jgi:hypothetical protein
MVTYFKKLLTPFCVEYVNNITYKLTTQRMFEMYHVLSILKWKIYEPRQKSRLRRQNILAAVILTRQFTKYVGNSVYYICVCV